MRTWLATRRGDSEWIPEDRRASAFDSFDRREKHEGDEGEQRLFRRTNLQDSGLLVRNIIRWRQSTARCANSYHNGRRHCKYEEIVSIFVVSRPTNQAGWDDSHQLHNHAYRRHVWSRRCNSIRADILRSDLREQGRDRTVQLFAAQVSMADHAVGVEHEDRGK